MDRTIRSVFDLWREYSEGIGSRPSAYFMYVLDRRHSFGKDGDTERRHYQRRNIILQYIISLATAHTVERAEAAVKLEEYRRAEKKTLSGLTARIKAGECMLTL